MAKKVNNSVQFDTKKVIPIVVISLLVVVLLFGIILGTISLIKEAGSVMSYGGVTVSPGVASYLISTYKTTHIESVKKELIGTGIQFMDTETFWAETKEGGDITYGDELISECTSFVKGTLICAYLFDRVASLTALDRETINTGVAEVLDIKAGGSVTKFNEMAEPMGFTFDDFKEATELLYKAERAKTAIYGTDGKNLMASSNVSLCEEYLSSMSHVKLLFIRTEDRFTYDEEGNRVTENGVDKLVPLSDGEKAERLSDIALIKKMIENIKTGDGTEMSPEAFDTWYTYRENMYNDDPDNSSLGYYFGDLSAYTAEFAKAYPAVIDEAIKMEIGEYSMVETSTGVCFIYKYEPVKYAYTVTSLEHFFADFYSDAATYHLMSSVEELGADVTVKDSFSEIDPRDLKYNSIFKLS